MCDLCGVRIKTQVEGIFEQRIAFYSQPPGPRNICLSKSRKCTSHLQVLFREKGCAAGGQTQKKNQHVGSERGVVCSRTRQEGQAARTNDLA